MTFAHEEFKVKSMHLFFLVLGVVVGADIGGGGVVLGVVVGC